MKLNLRLQSAARHVTPLVWSHAMIVLLAAPVAVFSNRPEMLVLAGPSLVLLAVTFAFAQPEQFTVAAQVNPPSGIEGDTVTLMTQVSSPRFIAHCDVEVELPAGLPASASQRVVSRCRPGETTSLDLDLQLAEWGIRSPETVTVQATDALGMVLTRQTFAAEGRIKVHLPDPSSRSLLDPARYLRVVGNHTSNTLGDGCEAADFREYRPGDRLRDINWRISARRGEEWITQRHPDRATTVVVILEALDDVGVAPHSSLRRSVRAAQAMVQSHLKVNDPVGLMIVGSSQRWIPPQIGNRQGELITEALLEIQSKVPSHQSLRPRDMIPPDCVVVGVSALGWVAADGRSGSNLLTILRGLRKRGQVVNVLDPEIAVAIPELKVGAPGAQVMHLVRRMTNIEHEVLRRQLRQEGLGVVEWRISQPIEPVLASFRSFHRSRAAKVI